MSTERTERYIKDQVDKVEGNISKVLRDADERVARYREPAFRRFPLLFTILASFGLVATFYGFERMIDGIDLFSENPVILLFTGIAVLIITGSLYKKLG